MLDIWILFRCNIVWGLIIRYCKKYWKWSIACWCMLMHGVKCVLITSLQNCLVIVIRWEHRWRVWDLVIWLVHNRDLLASDHSGLSPFEPVLAYTLYYLVSAYKYYDVNIKPIPWSIESLPVMNREQSRLQLWSLYYQDLQQLILSSSEHFPRKVHHI